MGYQGVTLLIAAVIGIGFAAYQYYTQRYTAQTQGNYCNGSHTYIYDPPVDTSTDNPRKRRGSSASSATETCIICYEVLSRNIKKLKCGHSFHAACIEGWFKESRTCPICREKAQ